VCAARWSGIAGGKYGSPDYGPLVTAARRTAGARILHTLWTFDPRDFGVTEAGQAIAKDEIFAHVGAIHENGGWPPHLHFLILDLLDRGAEFPGVGRVSERAV
jgi:hypothetical protein